MGTNECSQPASKSSWDSQDFGDVNMVLKKAHFHKSSRPQWFKRLNILDISDIFDKQCLKFYHKFCNDMLPVSFNRNLRCLYVKHGHTHQHDFRQGDEIRNSATRLIMAENVSVLT